MTERVLFDADALSGLYTEHLATLQDAYTGAMEANGIDTLVIHSGVASLQNPFDDHYWPLRPTPAFTHWLPLPKANTALVIQAGKRPRLFYQEERSFWESEVSPESDHFWDAFDEQEVNDIGAVGKELPGSRIAFIGTDDACAVSWGLAKDAINPAPLLRDLDQVRTRKSAYERYCIGEANRRASCGHQRLIEAFANGEQSELELHLLFLRETQQDDTVTPYKNIVALDEHASILHHVNYSAEPPRGKNHSLLVDAGAQCMGYASDVTRTQVKGTGYITETFMGLVSRMEALQQELCQAVRPGMRFEALHDRAHELLAPILLEIGISTASADELVASGATRCFFPHGLGHSLGLQVHDVGCRLTEPRADNPFLRNTSVIEAGQVFTIEPGCYFIESLMEELRAKPVGAAFDWDLVNELSYFGGVRIEDNIAVLEDRSVNLTRDNWPATT